MEASETFDFCILDVDNVVEESGSYIRMWGIQNGKLTVVMDRKFEPYFYAEVKETLLKKHIETLIKRILEVEINGERPKRVENVERKFLGKPKNYLKIVVKTPSNVPKFRDVVKEWSDIRDEYEYSVPFYRRYMIDNGLKPLGWIKVQGKPIGTKLKVDSAYDLVSMKNLEVIKNPKLRVLTYDLELAEEKGEEKIIMISLQDNAGFNKVLTYKKVDLKCVEALKDEKAILEKFIKHIQERNPQIIVGYNTDRFDFPKLEQRCQVYKTELKLGRDETPLVFKRRGRVSAAQIKGRIHIDLYSYVENILSQTLTSEVLTLDRVAKEILGVGKKEIKWQKIQEFWDVGRGLKNLVDYCQHDAKLTMLLAEHLLPQIFEICRVAGHTPFDVARMTYSQLVESVLMRFAFRKNEMIPNRPKFNEIKLRRKTPPYTGGYVHEPKEGIHENIAVFDFMSLYPSIIVSHNISPETLDCGCCKGKNKVPEGEHYYCTKERGFIPEILHEIIRKRIETKKKMSETKPGSKDYRRLFNQQFSFKVLSNAFYGYYGYAGSRWYSRVCAESTSSWGRNYIKEVIKKAESLGFEVIYGDTDSLFLKMRFKKNINEFLKKINEPLPGIMELEFKDLYKRGIFIEAKAGGAAKKKYALLDQKNKLFIRGLETRRRDWANIAKDTQERVLEAVLKDASPRKAVDIVRETIEKIKKGAVDTEDLIIYTQLTKSIKSYEQIGPHVAAAKKAIESGKPVGAGSVIRYIITKGSGSISDRAEPAEDAKDYDPEYYIHHQVIPPVLRILAGLGITEDDLLKEQSSLDNFIKRRI